MLDMKLRQHLSRSQRLMDFGQLIAFMRSQRGNQNMLKINKNVESKFDVVIRSLQKYKKDFDFLADKMKEKDKQKKIKFQVQSIMRTQSQIFVNQISNKEQESHTFESSIKELVQNSMNKQKMSEAHRLIRWLQKGDLQVYSTTLQTSLNSYQMLWLKQLLDPIAKDYEVLRYYLTRLHVIVGGKVNFSSATSLTILQKIKYFIDRFQRQDHQKKYQSVQTEDQQLLDQLCKIYYIGEYNAIQIPGNSPMEKCKWLVNEIGAMIKKQSQQIAQNMQKTINGNPTSLQILFNQYRDFQSQINASVLQITRKKSNKDQSKYLQDQEEYQDLTMENQANTKQQNLRIEIQIDMRNYLITQIKQLFSRDQRQIKEQLETQSKSMTSVKEGALRAVVKSVIAGLKFNNIEQALKAASTNQLIQGNIGRSNINNNFFMMQDSKTLQQKLKNAQNSQAATRIQLQKALEENDKLKDKLKLKIDELGYLSDRLVTVDQQKNKLEKPSKKEEKLQADIDEMKKKCNEEINSLQIQNGKMEVDLLESNKVRKQLQNKLERLSSVDAENAIVKRDLEEANTKINQLNTQIGQLKQQLKNSQNEKKQNVQQDKIKDLQQQLKQLDKIKSQQAETTTKMTEITNSYNNFIETLFTCLPQKFKTKYLKTQEIKNIDFEQKKSSIMAYLTQLQSQQIKINQNSDQKTKIETAVQSQITKLRKQNKKLESTIKDQREKIQRQTKILNNYLKDKKQGQRQESETKNREEDEKFDDQIQKLRNQNNTLVQTNTNLKNDIDTLNKENKKKEQELEKLQQKMRKMDEQKGSIQNHTTQNKNWEQQMKVKQGQIIQLRQKIQDQRTKVQKVTQQLQNQRKKLENQSKIESQAHSQVQAKKQILQQLNSAIQQKQSKKKQIEQFIAQYPGEFSQLQHLKKQTAQYKQQVQNLKNEQENIRNKITKVKQNLQNLEYKTKKYSEQEISKRETIIAELDTTLTAKNTEMKQLEANKSQLMKQLIEMRQNCENAKTELLENEKKNKSQKQQANKLKEARKVLINLKSQTEAQCQKKQGRLTKLQQQQKSVTENLNKMQAQTQKLKKDQQTITELMKNLEQNQRKKHELDTQIQASQKLVTNLATEEKQHREQLAQFKTQTEQLNKKIAEIGLNEKRLQDLVKKQQDKEKEFKEMEAKIASFKSQYRGYQEKLEAIKKQYENKEKQSREKLSALEISIKDSYSKLQQHEQDIKDVKANKIKFCGFPNRFFVGETLDDEGDRQFLIGQIQKKNPKKQISKTTLLFRYPLMSSINPHSCVDNTPNYLLLLKMKSTTKDNKHYTIAMYSQNPLLSTSLLSAGVGFIASLTNQKTFNLYGKNNPRITEYNEYFFVYGNSELRIRFGTDQLESNIGHLYKSFDTEGYKGLEIFTGEKEEKSTILTYEVYQIIFKE